jgi:hypothetical protein
VAVAVADEARGDQEALVAKAAGDEMAGAAVAVHVTSAA